MLKQASRSEEYEEALGPKCIRKVRVKQIYFELGGMGGEENVNNDLNICHLGNEAVN